MNRAGQGEKSVVVGLAIFVLLGLGYWAFAYDPDQSSPQLDICEAAIQSRLKAPSTYRRISADGGSSVWTIEYDAQNSFGVPLRSKGTCLITDDKATWIEDPGGSVNP